MKPMECEFESEVLSAVLQSRWPEGADARLREHAAQCTICSDVALVARALESAREETRAAAPIPDSGHVWRMAQLRSRREAAKSAGRPITAAQVIAFACATGLMGACFGATSSWFQAILAKTGSAAAALNPGPLMASAAAVISGHELLAFTGGAVLLLVPAAIYLTILKD